MTANKTKINPMTRKQSTVLILLAAYILIMGALTIYHAFNFSDYIHWKGNETINYTWFLLVTSVIFQIIVSLVAKRIDWKSAILGTIINFILSYIIGVGILILSGLEGIPRELIFIYGGCYLIFFTIVTVLQSYRLNQTSEG
jgi:hypothetical protein